MHGKKVAFYTLGCKLNYSETSTLGRLMSEAGFSTVAFQDMPDIVVINTCSVTDNADKKCRKVVKEALRYSPNAFVVVVGCYAQLKPTEITEITGVDLVLGASEKFNLVAHLTDLAKRERGIAKAEPIEHANTFAAAYSVGERTRSFLKIQDGCDYKCAFCTIPLARGSSRSDTIDNIVARANEVAQLGVQEIVLSGVNIGDYGKRIAGADPSSSQPSFLDLITALDRHVPVARFRISSIEPNLLTDDIIEFVAQSQRFMPHFHIPLQAGSNKMLQIMRRRYRCERYADRVSRIKQLMPHACIGVDVIVGHPGETHQDFLDTYQFLNDLDVSYLHVFTYSERANTHALQLKPIVPLAERHERSRMLHILSDKKRRFFYEQHLNTEREVLFEAEGEGGLMLGFTDNYIKVEASYDPLWVNERLNVQLTAISPEGKMLIEETTSCQLTK